MAETTKAHWYSRARRAILAGTVPFWVLGCEKKEEEPTATVAPSPDQPTATSRAERDASSPQSASHGESRPPAHEEQDVARAQAALMPLKKNLKATLKQALSEGGPAHAVEACKMEAPALAGDASDESALVGRSALRLRNPDNAPPDWVTPLMKELSAEKDPSGQARTADLPEGGFGYVESIVTGDLCVTCHGESVPPGVDAVLAKEYPQDEARGFEPGSFRGVFWVELKDG